MEFRLLGPLEIRDGPRAITLEGAKQVALLIRLLLDANRIVPAERLADDLWQGRPPPSATPTLQGYVTGVRRALQPGTAPASHMLRTRRPGYVLEVPPDSIDTRRFEQLVRSGQEALEAQHWNVASRTLADALALWRGPALADVADLRFAQAEAVRLEEARLTAAEGRLTADLALGRHAEVAAELEALVAAEPLRESLYALLMLALYRSGRQADALDRYQALRRALAEALGIDPNPELQRLQEAVLLQKSSLDWEPPQPSIAASPAHATSAAPPHNLPLDLTSFVGRDAEVGEVAADLGDVRLVSLVGPGGVGKTRLALRVARDVLAHFPDGVWLVELAPLDDPGLLAGRLLAVLGPGPEPDGDPWEALAEQIGQAELLVVLDNCEHVVTGCAELVAMLLRSCPGVRVLATSREPLRVPGERIRQVAPLPVPERAWTDGAEELDRYDAVRLFVDRASTMDPEFVLDRAHAEDVVRICRRLDGIPLALELAAARTRILSLPDIAARLDDRFRLLDGSPAALPRHRTLRAVMDWSYQLLSAAEGTLLGQLSVFAGGFSLAAAEHVGAAGQDPARPLEALAGLVDKSLVATEERAGGRRYWLLETVRQYAAGKLEEDRGVHAARDRHAGFYLEVAEAAAPGLYGAGLTERLARLADEHDNFRAALDWLAAAGDPAQLRLAAALWRYCYLRGHYRLGRAWLARALEDAPRSPPEPVADATHGAGALAFYQCDYGEAARHCEDALDRYRALGDRAGQGAVLTLLGSIAREQGDYPRAIGLHRQSLAIAEDLGDAWAVAHRLQMCGFAAWLSGDHEQAAAWSTQSLLCCRGLGDEERTAWALIDLGAVAHYTGDRAAAARLEEALDLSRRLGFTEGIAWSLNMLGLVAQERGDAGAAVAQLNESLQLHAEVGDRWRAASVLEALAATSVATDAEFAGRVLGAADAIRASIGAPIPPCERPLVHRTLGVLRRELGQACLDEVRAAGRTLSLQTVARQAALRSRGDGNEP